MNTLRRIIHFHPTPPINLFNSQTLSSLQCFFQPELQRELSFLFFSLLHLSFHPQAKVVHPIDRIGRSSRGSSSILADILSLQFSNSQEFDAQTVLERSEFRERHPSNSLQPGRSIARRTTKARHGLHHRRCVGHSIDPVSSRSPKKEFSWKSAPRGIATGGREPTFRPRISQYHHRPRFCALSPAHGREI